ncbi:MAG: LicD family protein [Methanobrevibacter sp.]|uniref:LicD family protein n=1 Tax=Methanobrevibacter sp. TaxID=66852 RepID=UPI002E7954FC|nr:LicD family protein [Methanobrevibacter sp.]MEE0935139.1 LicD family protein [Methanobrevibacter sp.]
MALFNRNKKQNKTENLSSNQENRFYDYEERMDKLEKTLTQQQEEIKSLKKENAEILDSYNNLFNILFIDCELKSKGLLKKSQEICQELFNFIVNVCKKHDIEYWLDYGTLLGAVRHDGFIPWDDDIDIAMMRKDYEKFHKIINEEIKNYNLDKNIEVFLYKQHTVLFTQITYTSSETGKKLAGFDIFPYDFIKSCDVTDIEQEFIKEKNNLKQAIKNNEDPQPYLDSYFEKFNVDYDKQDFVIGSIENIRCKISKYSFVILDANKIFPLSEIEFNGRTYSCPNDYDYYLKKIYGDYSKLPKVIDTHGRVDSLKDMDEPNEELEFNISKLKEINNLFQ